MAGSLFAARASDIPSRNSRGPGTARILWVLFSLFVVYGTTFPFTFDLEGAGLQGLLARINWHPLKAMDGDVSLPDIVQNILLFIPFGFLGFTAMEGRSGPKLFGLVALGGLLSVSVEIMQAFSRTRITSMADVVFNTLGTAMGVAAGALLKSWVGGIRSRPGSRRLLDAPSAFPALVFCGLAVVGTWMPFDFALDLSRVFGKVRPLLHGEARLHLPDDDLAGFIRFMLGSLFAFRLGRECGLGRPLPVLLPALAAAAVGLEATQTIIGSRWPTLQDAAVSVLGVLAGAIAFGFPGFREHPWKWGILGCVAVLASALMDGLHPFRPSTAWSGLNLALFRSEYEKTGFATLGNLVEQGMIYFPLGFLLCYFFPGSRRAQAAALALAGILSLAVELSQGFIQGRFGDATDVLAALGGCAAGCLVMTRGWAAYRFHVAAGRESRPA